MTTINGNNSVSLFFQMIADRTTPQFHLSERVREASCSRFGDALVQVAIEMRIQRLLAAGLIRLISPRHNEEQHLQQQQQQDDDEGEEEEAFKPCTGCVQVRCLTFHPAPPSITPDLVKSAMLREKLQFFAVRHLGGGGFEVTVENSIALDRLLREGGLLLHRGWYLRVKDTTTPRSSTKYTGRALCHLCQAPGHIRVMCIRQKPTCISAYGA